MHDDDTQPDPPVSASFPGRDASSRWWMRSTHKTVRTNPAYALKVVAKQEWGDEGHSTLAVRALLCAMSRGKPDAQEAAWGVWQQLLDTGAIHMPPEEAWFGMAWHARAWLFTLAKRYPDTDAQARALAPMAWLVERLACDPGYHNDSRELGHWFSGRRAALWPMLVAHLPGDALTPPLVESMLVRTTTTPGLLEALQQRDLIPTDRTVLAQVAVKRHSTALLALVPDETVRACDAQHQTMAMAAISAFHTNRSFQGTFIPKTPVELAQDTDKLAQFLVALQQRGVNLDARVPTTRKGPDAVPGRLKTLQCQRGETLWDALARRSEKFADFPKGLVEQLQAAFLRLSIDAPTARKAPRTRL